MSAPPSPLAIVGAALSALRSREDDVNRMNVFPVPDGDTGTNMVLTMQAVWDACVDVAPDDLTGFLAAATDGSLMGARGNSGVILSQVIRGLTDALDGGRTIDVDTLAKAVANADRVTLQAIRKPVAGTMLTVLSDAAREAKTSAKRADDRGAFLEAVLEAMWRSVERTPELLPVLAEAGVVDAGAFGLAVLAEGVVRAVLGGEVEVREELVRVPQQLSEVTEAEELEYTYCTEFLVKGDPPPVAEVRAKLEEMGGSLMVVGQPGLVKVHVHTNDPGEVLTYLGPFGTFAEVHISNMEEQTSERRIGLDLAAPGGPRAQETPPGEGERPTEGPGAQAEWAPTRPLAVVSVVAGDGLADIMRSLGAEGIVSGGQSMNPSTGEIAVAALETGAEHVIVLPNNKNVILAAEQVAAAFDDDRASGEGAPVLHVLPTKTIPEGLAALIAYEPEGEPEAVMADMTAERDRVFSGSVTTAVRDSTSKVGPVRAGDVIGVVGSEVRVIGSDVTVVAEDLTGLLAGAADGAETVTILAGADLPDAEAEALAEAVRRSLPRMEVEWHRGDQPLYPVIVGIQ